MLRSHLALLPLTTLLALLDGETPVRDHRCPVHCSVSRLKRRWPLALLVGTLLRELAQMPQRHLSLSSTPLLRAQRGLLHAVLLLLAMVPPSSNRPGWPSKVRYQLLSRVVMLFNFFFPRDALDAVLPTSIGCTPQRHDFSSFRSSISPAAPPHRRGSFR